jgi:toxin-antitoxin system PIN domain toxin
VILVDANLLIYAYDLTSPVHERARLWLSGAFSGEEPVGLCWTTILAFLRITTNPVIFKDPFSIAEAVAIIDDWLAQPSVRVVEPGGGHWGVLRELLTDSQAKGKLVMDAHLAALALEHGLTLFTRDGDFKEFRGLDLANPLAAE